MRLPLLLAALLASAPLAASEPKLDPHFEPIAYLVGHCWKAPFPNGKLHDVQCFQSLYDGKLIDNHHRVEGSDPLYQGKSVFSWDDANKRIRFHYFTSTGAVSEGYFVPGKDGMAIPERHVGSDGKVTELDHSFRRDGDDAYRVVTREKTDKGWVERMNLRYVRTDETP